MNQKRAKMLRREAQRITPAGARDRSLVVWKQQRSTTSASPNQYNASAAMNSPESVRGVYRQLKRMDEGGSYAGERRFRKQHLQALDVVYANQVRAANADQA